MSSNNAGTVTTTRASPRSAGATGHYAVPTNLWRMRRWQLQFEGAPVKQRVEQALATLAALQDAKIHPDRKIKSLRRLQRIVHPLLDELHQHFARESLPLPQKSRAMFECYLAIRERFARCYARVADQKGQQIKPRDEKIARALHASLALRGEILLACAQLYTALPPGFWRGVHSVYRHAEYRELAAMPVDPAGPGVEPRVRSPAAAYRHLLAFAAAETKALPRSQIAPAFTSMGACVGQEPLARQAISPEPGQPVLKVDLDSDAPPASYEGGSRVAPTKGLSETERLMDVAGLLSRLEAMGSAVDGEVSALHQCDTLSPSTVAWLSKCFHPRHAGRNSEREALTAGVEVITGLRSIQELLSAIITIDEVETLAASRQVEISNDLDIAQREWLGCGGEHRHAQQSEREILMQTIEERADTGSEAPTYGAQGSRARDAAATQREWRRPGARSANDSTHRSDSPPNREWILLDESATGIRLIWNAQRPSRASVGQLIGYCTGDETRSWSQWGLAEVRWMRVDDSSRLQIGAQTLAGRPFPGEVRPHTSERKRDPGRSDPAIVFDPGEIDEPTLVVPPYLYNEGDVVEVEVAHLRLTGELRATRAGTSHFTQFYLRTPPSESALAVRAATEHDDNGELTSLGDLSRYL